MRQPALEDPLGHHYHVARIDFSGRVCGHSVFFVATISANADILVVGPVGMAAAGIDLGAIMHAGGWKSANMVMRYIEHMDVQKSGMARLYTKTLSLQKSSVTGSSYATRAAGTFSPRSDQRH